MPGDPFRCKIPKLPGIGNRQIVKENMMKRMIIALTLTSLIGIVIQAMVGKVDVKVADPSVSAGYSRSVECQQACKENAECYKKCIKQGPAIN